MVDNEDFRVALIDALVAVRMINHVVTNQIERLDKIDKDLASMRARLKEVQSNASTFSTSVDKILGVKP